MLYSTIVAAVLVSVAAADPSSITRRDGLISAGGSIHPIPAADLQDGSNTQRDGLTNVGGSIQPVPADDLQALSKRGSHVSKCGGRGDSQTSGWIPVDDDAKKGLVGYLSAAKSFCYHATHNIDGLDTVIGPGLQYSDEIFGVTLTSGTKGHVNFVIQNTMKQGSHTVKEDDCNSYLAAIADSKKGCYGTKNKDTKGGTYWVDGTGNYKSMPGTGGN